MDSVTIEWVGVFAMNTDNRNLLSVLRKELEFLEKGGYHDPDSVPWRPKFIFQDSPACLNFDLSQQPKPCSDCALTQLVPENLRDKKIPCRYIPLNEKGETIDSFYRSGTRRELEAAFRGWLRTTILSLQDQILVKATASESVEIHVKAKAALT